MYHIYNLVVVVVTNFLRRRGQEVGILLRRRFLPLVLRPQVRSQELVRRSQREVRRLHKVTQRSRVASGARKHVVNTRHD